ncbi:MAG: hypothetical protein WDZ72_13645 [Cyclobacteriaceae bacterium]
MRENISEENDLSAREIRVALKLLEKLRNWVADVNAPVPIILNQ